MRRSSYGNYGGPVKLLEMYEGWRDERLALQEADSKADFATFLFGPISQSFYNGYARVLPQYRRYARIEAPRDFKEHRIRGINDLTGFGYVGDHGDYPEMERTERPSAAIVVDTYGAIYKITRQLIRNDDTGELLRRVPDDMGRQAALHVVRALIALIESNPVAPDGTAMFHSSRGNAHTLELSEDNLATVVAAMEEQLDDNGNPIVIRPSTLAVKSMRLQLIARRILNSQLTGVTVNDPVASSMDKGTANVVGDILPNDAVVRDPFWTDSNNWYLFANPADVPGFALAFLDGNETPFIGLKNPLVRSAVGAGEDPYEYEIDTLDFKTRHDYGLAPVDPRGVARSVVP